ncbi:hypothetical protein PQS31_06265 [Luteimonas sp BLCC-B24]|uniref:hypothetical protein n=1 Tax=Luteimonas sp. BLCC-B24 TaxID=3025317 RepID=UPI00234C8055|nr:hypothetical protein [Luteimonas sp. BLCC-B24]MDC7806428.1 hypothetical protein [Luteimonas sp. BLCC-B24]
MPCRLGTIDLPDDVEWIDEFKWTPVAQQVEVTCGGALIVEESAQLKGRPITLRGVFDGRAGYALPTRAVIKQLHALASLPRSATLPLLLEDGRTFNVRFRHDDGMPLDAEPIRHIAPHIDSDWYAFTLRLMEA